jgi:zinc/manganese transport system substrate-binding protein
MAPISIEFVRTSIGVASSLGRFSMTTSRMLLLLGALLGAVAGAASARAELRVFSCEPQWAALAREIGGDRVRVDSATTAHQDVHYIQARPSLISKMRRADLLVFSGADLEIGWLPLLLRQASNRKVQPGETGHLDVSRVVPMLGVATRIDRSAGDIHPYGNPHTQTDPHNVARVAAELARRMSELDPDGKDSYQSRYDEFAARWTEAVAGWELRAAPLRGTEIITHHLAWVYMAHWLGLVVVGHLEATPGIPPTVAHLAKLLDDLEQQPVRAIVRATYQPERPSKWLSERSGIPAIVLPHCVGSTPGATDLFAMFDDMVSRLLEAAQ